MHVATQLFCRYGLSDSDCEFDDDEDDGGSQVPMQEKTQTQQQKQTQPPKQASTGVTDKAAPVRQGYGLFEEDELMDDDSGSDQTGMPDSLLLQFTFTVAFNADIFGLSQLLSSDTFALPVHFVDGIPHWIRQVVLTIFSVCCGHRWS